MKKDTSYHDFVVYDLMARLPDITSRAMMGGWIIYSKGIPFAAIFQNQLHLKAKGESADTVASLGWTKFTYQKAGSKSVSLSYWRVPDDLIDDQLAFEDIPRHLLLLD